MWSAVAYSLCVISGFCHEVDENYILLGYCTVNSGNSLSTFWDNQSVNLCNPQLIGCPETSVGNCHCLLGNNPEESNSYTDLSETFKLKNPQKHFIFCFMLRISSVFLFLLLSETWSSMVLNLEVTRQAMYIYCNIEMHLCNYCCSRKAISVRYSECVFVTLSIKYVVHMHHIVTCGRPGCTIFFHVTTLMARLSKKVTVHKMCVWFSLQL
jgi:hypothetical protein